MFLVFHQLHFESHQFIFRYILGPKCLGKLFKTKSKHKVGCKNNWSDEYCDFCVMFHGCITYCDLFPAAVFALLWFWYESLLIRCYNCIIYKRELVVVTIIALLLNNWFMKRHVLLLVGQWIMIEDLTLS